MIPVPQNFCDTLKALHKDFIWSGKKPNIKHSTLIGDCCEGGSRDVDIDAELLSLKFIWTKRFKDPNSHPWKVVDQLLSQVGSDAIFRTNLCLSDNFKKQANKLPLFYKELINVWEKMSKFENMNGNDILA